MHCTQRNIVIAALSIVFLLSTCFVSGDKPNDGIYPDFGPNPESFNFYGPGEFIASGTQGAIFVDGEVIMGPLPATLLVSKSRLTWVENFTNAIYVCNSTGCWSQFPQVLPGICYHMTGLDFSSQGEFWGNLRHDIDLPLSTKNHGELLSYYKNMKCTNCDNTANNNDDDDWIHFDLKEDKKVFCGVCRDIGACCTDFSNTVFMDQKSGIQELVQYGQEVPVFLSENGASTFSTYIQGFVSFNKYKKHVRDRDIPELLCDQVLDSCDTMYGQFGYCNQAANVRYPYTITLQDSTLLQEQLTANPNKVNVKLRSLMRGV